MKKLVPYDAVLIPGTAKLVFKGEIFDTFQWEQKLFDGSSATFEMIRRVDSVNVVAIADDKILIVEDSQPARPTMLGYPGGRIDAEDISVESAARREVLEETGFEFKQWRLFKAVQPQMKIEWFVYYFIAWDGQKVADQQLDSGEKITVRHLSLPELHEAAHKEAGYLNECEEVLQANSVEEVKNIPEFSGQIIEH